MTGTGRRVTERRYLARFGGEVHASRNGAFGLVIRDLLWSREYTVADRVNYFRGILGSMRLLWPELLQVDLFQTVPEIKVPVFFVEGRVRPGMPLRDRRTVLRIGQGAIQGADLVRPFGPSAQLRGAGPVQPPHGDQGTAAGHHQARRGIRLAAAQHLPHAIEEPRRAGAPDLQEVVRPDHRPPHVRHRRPVEAQSLGGLLEVPPTMSENSSNSTVTFGSNE